MGHLLAKIRVSTTNHNHSGPGGGTGGGKYFEQAAVRYRYAGCELEEMAREKDVSATAVTLTLP